MFDIDPVVSMSNMSLCSIPGSISNVPVPFSINGVAAQNSYSKYPNSKPCHSCERTHSQIRDMRPDAVNEKKKLPMQGNFPHCDPMIKRVRITRRWVDWPLHGTKNLVLQIFLGFLLLWGCICGDASKETLKRMVLRATARDEESKGVWRVVCS